MTTSQVRELPTDLITMREACALTDKSVDTIRRWRKVKALKAYQAEGEPTAAVRLSKSEVLRCAADAAVQPESPSMARRVAGLKHQGGDTSSTAIGERAALQANLTDLRHERDALLEELRATRAELRSTREDLRALATQANERDARIRVLEAELNGGVRGLLRGVGSRFGLSTR